MAGTGFELLRECFSGIRDFKIYRDFEIYYKI